MEMILSSLNTVYNTFYEIFNAREKAQSAFLYKVTN